MPLPALIFDFGNVIAFFDYMLTFDRLGKRIGTSGQELRARLDAAGFWDLAHRFESGLIEPEDFARQTMTLAGVSMTHDEFVADWEDIFTLNEPVGKLIPELKAQGYPLLLGSNTNILHARHYRQKFREVLDRFDHFILSYEVRVMKPERGFFDACVAAAGVPADSCLFIDDAEPNVAGARRAGLQALVYRDHSELLAELARHGVKLPPSLQSGSS
jgi:FMN phosphatase YigB (HAD superfamily)